jgi:tetratricopeptide (TPR) repeat protein
MAFSEDMFALVKTRDWEACRLRIEQESPGKDQKSRFSIAYWLSVVLQYEGQYEEALRALDKARGEFFSQCAFAYFSAQILCQMGKFAQAGEMLRGAPFGDEIDAFPGLTYEAIFLYCYLLIKAGREAPPNLIDALPDNFRTFMYDRRFRTKSDLQPTLARPASDPQSK